MRHLFHYVVAGRRLDCDVPLPELRACRPAAARDMPAIRVSFSPCEPLPRSISWPDASDEDPVPERPLRIGACEEGYVLDYPGSGQFVVREGGERIECHPEPGASAATARQLLLDRALPLVLGLKGDVVVLHAGAVAFDERGVALVGPSGRGKSTLVAFLGSRAAQVLTDDCLVLRKRGGEWHAMPYYTGLRLWPESLLELDSALAGHLGLTRDGDKQRIPGTGPFRFRTDAVPLRMIAFLADDEAPADVARQPVLERLAPREAFFALLSETFTLELKAAPALRRQFDGIGALVDDVPAYRLSFPRRFGALPSVEAAIVAAIPGVGASAGQR